MIPLHQASAVEHGPVINQHCTRCRVDLVGDVALGSGELWWRVGATVAELADGILFDVEETADEYPALAEAVRIEGVCCG